MMREHELSCNTHSNNCDRLRVCQEKLYLAKLLLLWPYTTKLNNLSYYIPRGQGGRLQSKIARRIWRMSEKILHLGGCICNTLRWAMKHEGVPGIMRGKASWCRGPVLFPDPHQVAGFIYFSLFLQPPVANYSEECRGAFSRRISNFWRLKCSIEQRRSLTAIICCEALKDEVRGSFRYQVTWEKKKTDHVSSKANRISSIPSESKTLVLDFSIWLRNICIHHQTQHGGLCYFLQSSFSCKH